MGYRIPWDRFFLFLHVLCLLLCSLHHTTYGCSVEERAALMEIRSSLVNANATVPRSWGSGGDCCSWERVNCSGRTQRVSHLYLSELYDISTVPSTHGGRLFWSFNTTVFSAFSELQFLDLSRNYPSSLVSDGLVGLNLTKLQYLNLSGNWLGKSILAPLGELVSLQVLDLNFNGMRGVLPVAVFENLTNLRELNLSNNQFNGSLPKTFSLFVWLVADGWCWLVLREKYCWLVVDGWFILREKYCWLVADKPSEQGVCLNFLTLKG